MSIVQNVTQVSNLSPELQKLINGGYSSTVVNSYDLEGLSSSYNFSDSSAEYVYGVKNSTANVANDLLLYGASSGLSSSSATASLGASASRSVYGSAAVYSSSASSSKYSSVYLSEIEASILRSVNPIEISETELITILGNRGVWVNKAEVQAWRGDLPISSYLINEDANPEIITKKVALSLEYVQELAIRYLRPPTPPAPGEIIIKQEANIPTAPAPPLIIRQQPARPKTPEPLIIREAPPAPPATVGRKLITISGRRIPPPPRKVVIERLPQLPVKPQAVFIERWLPYAEVKRKVVFQANQVPDPVIVKPRNVIVQWEAPDVRIKKEFKYLGVVDANPADYVARYGAELKVASQLPQFVLDIQTPNGLVLAANYKHNSVFELEGDLQALNLIDLDKEGLSEYRRYLGLRSEYGFSSSSTSAASSAFSEINVSSLIQQLFSQIDINNSGAITLDEAQRIVIILNSRSGRNYEETDVRTFFSSADLNADGRISYSELRRILLSYFY